mmetsp:Transcript_17730/g.29797  ORF Transcript_17730/g.29797 Transcript_17730/m.29797 type:complete len:176 (+) Transcript_17730:318-845(+)
MINFSSLPHPRTAMFHVGFKAAALVVYLLCEWFVSAYVFNFISIVTLLALDFWTVKNVSGRLLVGLRWWNEVTEEGDSVWKYESLDMEGLKNVHPEESRIFWYALYLTPVAWSVFGFIALVKFNIDYFMIVVVAIVLSVSNIVGYTKCSKDAKRRLSEFTTQTLASGVSSMFSGF